MTLKTLYTGTLSLIAAMQLQAQTVEGGYNIGDKWGVKGKDGTFIIPQIYDYIAASNAEPDYFIVQKGDEFGIANAKGQFIFPVEYREPNHQAYTFVLDGDAYYAQHQAFVLRNRAGKFGVIQDYKIVVPFEYDMIVVSQGDVSDNPDAEEPIYRHVINAAYLEKNGEVHTYDIEKKKLGTKLLGSALLAGTYNGYALVQKGNAVICYDKESVAPQAEDTDALMTYTAMHNGKYGIINQVGELMLPTEYEDIVEWNAEYNAVIIKKGGQTGVVDFKGKQILPCAYNKVSCLLDCYSVDNAGLYFMAAKADLYAIFDPNGKAITDFKYTYAGCGMYNEVAGFDAYDAADQHYFIEPNGKTTKLAE